MTTGRRWARGLLVATILCLARPGPAAAGDGTQWSLRLFGGLENGAAVGLSGVDGRLSAELAQAYFISNRGASLTEVSLIGRTGAPGFWVGGRLGYQLGVFFYTYVDDPDVSHTVDAGLVGGYTSPGGHSLRLEAGAERVHRGDRFICCDSSLDTTSLGARVVLAGHLHIRPGLAGFARMGVRTAEHLVEIKLLPVVSLGVVMNF